MENEFVGALWTEMNARGVKNLVLEPMHSDDQVWWTHDTWLVNGPIDGEDEN